MEHQGRAKQKPNTKILRPGVQGGRIEADMDAMNRRNELLIKQLVDSHSAETRQLRDMLLQQERKVRE